MSERTWRLSLSDRPACGCAPPRLLSVERMATDEMVQDARSQILEMLAHDLEVEIDQAMRAICPVCGREYRQRHNSDSGPAG